MSQLNIDNTEISDARDSLESDIQSTISNSQDQISLDDILDATQTNAFSTLTDTVVSSLHLGSNDLNQNQKQRLESFIKQQAKSILDKQVINGANVSTICNLYAELQLTPTPARLEAILNNSSDIDLTSADHLRKLKDSGIVTPNEFINAYESIFSSQTGELNITRWLTSYRSLGQSTLAPAQFPHIAEQLSSINFDSPPLNLFTIDENSQSRLLNTITDTNVASKFNTNSPSLRDLINRNVTDHAIRDALLNTYAGGTSGISDFDELTRQINASLTTDNDEAKRVISNHLATHTFAGLTDLTSFLQDPNVTRYANPDELKSFRVPALRSVLSSTTTDPRIRTWLNMWHESGQNLTTTEFPEVAGELNEINFEVPPLQNFGLNNDQIVTLLASTSNTNGLKFRTTNQDLRNLINTRIADAGLRNALLQASNVTPTNTISNFTELESQLALNVNVDQALAKRIVTEHFETESFANLDAIQTLLDNPNVQNILAEYDRKRLAQAAVVRISADNTARSSLTVPTVGVLGDWIRVGSREFLNGSDLQNNQNYEQEQAFNIIAFCLQNSSVNTDFNFTNGRIDSTDVSAINTEMYTQLFTRLSPMREINLSSYITNLSRGGFINVLEQFTADELQRVILERRPDYVNHLTTGATNAELIRLLTTGQTAEQVQNNADRLNMNTLVTDFSELGNQYNAGTTLDTDAYRQRAREVITLDFNSSDFAGLENLLRDRVVLNYFPDDTERLNLAKTRLVTSLLTESERSSYISGLDTIGGYLRDVCVAASERALRASDIVSNRVYNLDDQNELDEIFGILMFASCQVNGASRAGGSEITDSFTANAVQRTITTPSTLGNYNTTRGAELTAYNDDVDRLVVGLETESERARAMRDPQTAPHLIHTMQNEMITNLLTAANFGVLRTGAAHANIDTLNQRIEQQLADPASIFANVRNLTVLAIALHVNGDIGSDRFREDLITKVRAQLMTNTAIITPAGINANHLNITNAVMADRQQRLYEDVMERYSGQDINRLDVQNRIAAEVAQRAMEDRLNQIQEESERQNNAGLLRVLSSDWGGRMLPEGVGNAALAIGSAVAASGATWPLVKWLATGVGTGLKTFLTTTSFSYLPMAASFYFAGKAIKSISDYASRNNAVSRTSVNQTASDLLASNAILRFSNGQMKVQDSSDTASSTERRQQIQTFRTNWNNEYRDLLNANTTTLRGTGGTSDTMSERITTCINNAYGLTSTNGNYMNVNNINAKGTTRGRAVGLTMQRMGSLGLLGAPWLLGKVWNSRR